VDACLRRDGKQKNHDKKNSKSAPYSQKLVPMQGLFLGVEFRIPILSPPSGARIAAGPVGSQASAIFDLDAAAIARIPSA
jgi:hypothetical protein